jgi:hypothetical protein
MKDSLQMPYELGFAACVVAAAIIALALMVGHAAWKSMVRSE